MQALQFLLDNKLALTRNEAARLIKQGGLWINEQRVIVEEHQSVLDVEVQPGDNVRAGRNAKTFLVST